MAELRLRRAGPEDGKAIRELLRQMFPNNSKLDPAIMQWQYWNNPFGSAITSVFEDGNRIVSHHTLVPVPMKLKEKTAMGVVGVDAATLPEFRGKGLHKELRQYNHEECRRRGYQVSMFFPSRGSMIPQYSRKGAEVPGGYFRVHLWPRFFPRRPSVRGSLKGESSEDRAPPEGLDELWSKLEHTYPNTVVGTQAWWEWRYGSRPGGDYRFFALRSDGRLQAAAVTTVRPAFRGRYVQLLDLLVEESSAARPLMEKIRMSHPGVTGLTMSALPGTPPARVLRAAGFWRLPRRLDSRRQVVEIRDLLGQKLNLDPWSVTWGHMDVV